MGGFVAPLVSAIAPATGIVGSAVGGGGLLGSVLSTVAQAAFSGAPDAPSTAPAPQAPAAAQAPTAPTVSEAPEAVEERVVDTEAARVRAQKRRRADEERRLFDLEDDASIVLTKSLLGE